MGPRKTTTRERLITTAAELFRRQGYAQTGVNQIIREAKATSGSFYHFFPAKEDLLLAVVDHMAEVFEAEVFSPSTERADVPVEEIFAILDRYRRQLHDGGFTFGSPMAILAAEVSENHPQVRARLAEVFTNVTGRVEDLLDLASNRLPRGLDHTSLAQLIVCAMEGAVLGTRLSHSLASFDAVATQLKTYLDLLGQRTEAPTVVPAARNRIPVAPPRTTDWRSW